MAALSRVVFVFALASSGEAAVTLPYLLADHMVVQRGLPVHIWGRAEPGERVTVGFRGAGRSAATDARKVERSCLRASGRTVHLTINATTLTDILVGDVDRLWTIQHSGWSHGRPMPGRGRRHRALPPRLVLCTRCPVSGR
jgi:hypothetical protein